MVTTLDEPPLRLLLGRDVPGSGPEKIAAMAASIDQWESVTNRTSFPQGVGGKLGCGAWPSVFVGALCEDGVMSSTAAAVLPTERLEVFVRGVCRSWPVSATRSMGGLWRCGRDGSRQSVRRRRGPFGGELVAWKLGSSLAMLAPSHGRGQAGGVSRCTQGLAEGRPLAGSGRRHHRVAPVRALMSITRNWPRSRRSAIAHRGQTRAATRA